MTDSNFYRAFEDRYRGSRELIKSRLTVYLPFILPLQQFFDSCQGIDLGCGRGEWLELMQENGIATLGIDFDQGMLAVARERGLNVIHGDAIQFLQTQAANSQMLISGFHLVEHIPFETLRTLIQESLRVLKPGGLLILETPNPENIVVGTEKFYLDPSHHRPIPAQFLSFMTEYAGFHRVKVLRLQEPNGLANSNSLILLSVLNGVSPDYAVISQKEGAGEIHNATAAAFEADYGLSLEKLANQYDRQIKIAIQQATAKAQQAGAKAQQAEDALISIYSSSSWRITAPLRKITSQAISFLNFARIAIATIRHKLMLFLIRAFLYLNRRRHLRFIAKLGFLLFPSIKYRIDQSAQVTSNKMPLGMVATTPENLTPRARKIYDDLKSTLANSQKEGS